jgi:hypothetical protein
MTYEVVVHSDLGPTCCCFSFSTLQEDFRNSISAQATFRLCMHYHGFSSLNTCKLTLLESGIAVSPSV